MGSSALLTLPFLVPEQGLKPRTPPKGTLTESVSGDGPEADGPGGARPADPASDLEASSQQTRCSVAATRHLTTWGRTALTPLGQGRAGTVKQMGQKLRLTHT